MGDRSRFMVWGALLLLVALSLALTAESSHSRHRHRSEDSVFQRGFGRTTHEGREDEHTRWHFGLGEIHHHRHRGGRRISHFPRRKGGVAKTFRMRNPDRHGGMTKSDRLTHTDQHFGIRKTQRLDHPDQNRGARKNYGLDHSEDVKKTDRVHHPRRHDGVQKTDRVVHSERRNSEGKGDRTRGVMRSERPDRPGRHEGIRRTHAHGGIRKTGRGVRKPVHGSNNTDRLGGGRRSLRHGGAMSTDRLGGVSRTTRHGGATNTNRLGDTRKTVRHGGAKNIGGLRRVGKANRHEGTRDSNGLGGLRKNIRHGGARKIVRLGGVKKNVRLGGIRNSSRLGVRKNVRLRGVKYAGRIARTSVRHDDRNTQRVDRVRNNPNGGVRSIPCPGGPKSSRSRLGLRIGGVRRVLGAATKITRQNNFRMTHRLGDHVKKTMQQDYVRKVHGLSNASKNETVEHDRLTTSGRHGSGVAIKTGRHGSSRRADQHLSSKTRDRAADVRNGNVEKTDVIDAAKNSHRDDPVKKRDLYGDGKRTGRKGTIRKSHHYRKVSVKENGQMNQDDGMKKSDQQDGMKKSDRHNRYSQHNGAKRIEWQDNKRKSSFHRREGNSHSEFRHAYKASYGAQRKRTPRVSYDSQHRKYDESGNGLLKATAWPLRFTINFTTTAGEASGRLAYDQTQRRLVMYHGANSTFCVNHGTEEACQVIETPNATTVYIPLLEQCFTSTQKLGWIHSEWVVSSEYVGTEEIPYVGQCRAFKLIGTEQVYFETVNGSLPCAVEFPDPALSYRFLPETFEVGIPDRKSFNFPDFCLTSSNDEPSNNELRSEVLNMKNSATSLETLKTAQ